MSKSRRGIDRFSTEELEQALQRRRHDQRRERLKRLKKEGRVLDIAFPADETLEPTPKSTTPAAPQPAWRVWSNRLLLVVEVGAVFGLIAIIYSLVTSVLELNADIADVQAQQSSQAVVEVAAAEPTAEVEPVIGLVVLPTGHQPPVDGRPIVFEEAGSIPNHLLPLIDDYVPPPVPTPSPEQARLIEIPNIEVNAPIVLGHEPEQLKKGVGHSIGTANAGELGNMVLSAHNDIYGEIFRHLDKLNPGDQVVVSTGRQRYTYVINEIRVVEPTAVEVMAPTEHASLTLISCYPYLINNKRIVVFADLVEDGGLNS